MEKNRASIREEGFRVSLLGADPDWVFENQDGIEAILVYALRGGSHSSIWRVDESQYELRQGHVLLAPPGRRIEGKGNGCFALASIPGELFDLVWAFVPRDEDTRPMVVKVGALDAFYLDFHLTSLYQVTREKQPLWQVAATIHIFSALLRVLEWGLNLGAVRPGQFCHPEERAGDRIAKLVLYMAEHPEERYSVPLMARRCFMSERSFFRRFRNQTGFTPLQMLTRLRLGKAREFLESGEMTISQVSDLSGFSGPRNLYETFRRHMEESPGTIRRKGRRPERP